MPNAAMRLLPPLFIAALIGASAPAAATVQRAFVASYGVTANTAFNCSIAKPCRAFSEAVSVTNPGGEVIVLDSAGYGVVVIGKSVSIIAPPGIYAGVSVFTTDGIVVNAGATDIVILRGLSINGQGGSRGIFFQAAARLRIENCVVSGLGNEGISHAATGGEMIVLDTIVRDNLGTGIFVNGDNAATVLDHVRSEHNQGDGFHLAPPAGSSGTTATVANSVFTHNTGKGIWADTVAGATTTIVVERSVMASNGQDGFAATGVAGGSADGTLMRNAIDHNGGNGIWILGSAEVVASENAVHRNGGTGILADGTARGYVSANSGVKNQSGIGMTCNSATGLMFSIRNNLMVDGVSGTGSCYVAGTGN